VSGELEAAAADTLGHVAAGRHGAAPGQTCANCGAMLAGRYCHDCGQSADTHKRSLLHLAREAVEGLFEVDGRLARTVPALFFRPGALARDYLEGRIARHVPPFRTFLVALLLLIFAAQHATHQMTLANAREAQARTARLATPQGRAAEAARLRQEALKDRTEELREEASERADDLRDPDHNGPRVEARFARQAAKTEARYAAALDQANRVALGLPPKADAPDAAKDRGWFHDGVKKATGNPDYYLNVLFDWAHRAAILLLPIVGLSLAAVYRRRKDIVLYDHLLVAMNLLSFGFLTSALGLMLPFSLMGWWFAALIAWTLINLYQTLRGAYGSSRLGAAVKTLAIWTLTAVSFFILLTGLMVFSLTQL